MTNRAKILSLVKAYETDVDSLDGALIDALLEPEAEYDPTTDKAKLNAAAVFVLDTVRPVKSESEGGYSKTYEDTRQNLIQALKGKPVARFVNVM